MGLGVVGWEGEVLGIMHMFLKKEPVCVWRSEIAFFPCNYHRCVTLLRLGKSVVSEALNVLECLLKC